jgi:threonine/homoserine/homoserine lactone efflux protein
MILFSKAFLLGWMVAIPVGPVGLLIIQRSLKVGSLAGVASGLGAALADGLFGFLAAVGLATLIGELEASRQFVRPLGSLVLMVVGVYFFFQKPPPLETEEVLSVRYLHHYLWDLLSTFFLTLLNPLTIIAFAALFIGSDLIPEDPRKIQYLEVAGGIFSGSLLWWLLLVFLASPVKKALSSKVVHRIFQGIGLTLFGLALLSFIPRLGTMIDKLRLLMSRVGP